MSTLTDFSRRRVIGMFLLDWLGSAAALAAATVLRPVLGELPGFLTGMLRAVGVPTGEANWLSVTAASQFAEAPTLPFLVLAIWPPILFVFSVYDGLSNRTLRQELRNVFVAIVVAALTLAGILFLTYRQVSRVLFLLFILLDLGLLLGSRVLWWGYRRWTAGSRPKVRYPVLVVGGQAAGKQVIDELQRFSGSNHVLVGYVDEVEEPSIGALPYLGVPDKIPELVSVHAVSDAVVVLPLAAHEQLVAVCRMLQEIRVRVHVVPDLFALAFPSASLEGFGGIPVISLGTPGLRAWARIRKRVFDLVVAVATLAILWPVILLIAVAIKLDSRGPIFFKQNRIGENGEPFTILKFRTMRPDADSRAHCEHVTRLITENLTPDDLDGSAHRGLKMANDDRVTRIGKLLRRTSIDELPQLFNVVRNDMSLVGPRPLTEYEFALFKDWHCRRHDGPAGITGPWQAYARNQVSFDEMVRMDIDYFDKASAWVDLKILVKTTWSVLTGRGAA